MVYIFSLSLSLLLVQSLSLSLSFSSSTLSLSIYLSVLFLFLSLEKMNTLDVIKLKKDWTKKERKRLWNYGRMFGSALQYMSVPYYVTIVWLCGVVLYHTTILYSKATVRSAQMRMTRTQIPTMHVCMNITRSVRLPHFAQCHTSETTWKYGNLLHGHSLSLYRERVFCTSWMVPYMQSW